jgi:Secretion system C-terminal sorting domain
MKTNPFKSSITIALVAMAIGASAQTGNQKKTCITIENITDGKVTHIDTCFTGLDETEIQKQLQAMGIKDFPKMNIKDFTNLQLKNIDITTSKMDSVWSKISSMKFFIDTDGNKNDSTKNEVIIINGNKDGKDGKNSTVIVGGNGYSYTTADDDDGSAKTEVLISSSGSNGKSNKVKVYVFKKVEVKDVSDEDKRKIHSDVLTEGTPFTGLKMYPNPTEATLTISYNSISTEPLKINVYDVNGKTIDTETVTDPGTTVNKTISLSSFGPGIYFVQLIPGTQTEIKKIVVK